MTVLRTFCGLLLFFLGVMQAGITWRGLRGLSLTRRCRWGGHLLSACMILVGLALSASPLLWVTLCALPAALSAMGALVLLSSWINQDLHPPDVRRPGEDDPWTCEAVTFVDGTVDTPALLLKPRTSCGGVVCWVHGSGDEKAGFKWTMVRGLTRRGIAVLTFDLPGHGEHPAEFSLPEALTAVPSALAYLAQRPDLDGLPVGVLGVSLGGALTIRALAGLARQVPSAPSVPLPGAVCLLETPCALYLDRRLRWREALGMASLPALDVFADTSVLNLLRRYRAKPRPRFAASVQWAFDDLAPASAIAEMPSLPLLIVSGGRDPIALPKHGDRLYERARTPKEYRVIRAGSHLTLIFLAETVDLVAEWFASTLSYQV